MLSTILKSTRRILHLTRMHQVMRFSKRYGIPFTSAEVLEVFGGTGELQTLDYAAKCKSIELWEYDPDSVKQLRVNVPFGKVKETDSYLEIKNCTDRYDVVIVDNALQPFEDKCEHFEIIDDVFRVMKDRCLLVINVAPYSTKKAKLKYPDIFNELQLQRRAAFYKTDHPENVTFGEMEKIYSNLANTNGYDIKASLFVSKTSILTSNIEAIFNPYTFYACFIMQKQR